jgi:hypothetical protein
MEDGRGRVINLPNPAPPVVPDPYFGCAFEYAPCESVRPRRVEVC